MQVWAVEKEAEEKGGLEYGLWANLLIDSCDGLTLNRLCDLDKLMSPNFCFLVFKTG